MCQTRNWEQKNKKQCQNDGQIGHEIVLIKIIWTFDYASRTWRPKILMNTGFQYDWTKDCQWTNQIKGKKGKNPETWNKKKENEEIILNIRVNRKYNLDNRKEKSLAPLENGCEKVGEFSIFWKSIVGKSILKTPGYGETCKWGPFLHLVAADNEAITEWTRKQISQLFQLDQSVGITKQMTSKNSNLHPVHLMQSEKCKHHISGNLEMRTNMMMMSKFWKLQMTQFACQKKVNETKIQLNEIGVESGCWMIMKINQPPSSFGTSHFPDFQCLQRTLIFVASRFWWFSKLGLNGTGIRTHLAWSRNIKPENIALSQLPMWLQCTESGEWSSFESQTLIESQKTITAVSKTLSPQSEWTASHRTGHRRQWPTAKRMNLKIQEKQFLEIISWSGSGEKQ